MPQVQMLCLANSRKHSNRCVAGLTMVGSGWVRPVSDLPDCSLRHAHYTCEGGHKAALLDILSINLIHHEPRPHQPENWRIGSNRWRFVGSMSSAKAATFLAPYLIAGPDLLGNSLDRIPYVELSARPGTASLAMVEPNRIRWDIRSRGPGNRRVRARFELAGGEFNLSVTDPEFEFMLIRLNDGLHDNAAVGFTSDQRIMLTISLGEPFEGDCYKLVVAVIALDRS